MPEYTTSQRYNDRHLPAVYALDLNRRWQVRNGFPVNYGLARFQQIWFDDRVPALPTSSQRFCSLGAHFRLVLSISGEIIAACKQRA